MYFRDSLISSSARRENASFQLVSQTDGQSERVSEWAKENTFASTICLNFHHYHIVGRVSACGVHSTLAVLSLNARKPIICVRWLPLVFVDSPSPYDWDSDDGGKMRRERYSCETVLDAVLQLCVCACNLDFVHANFPAISPYSCNLYVHAFAFHSYIRRIKFAIPPDRCSRWIQRVRE